MTGRMRVMDCVELAPRVAARSASLHSAMHRAPSTQPAQPAASPVHAIANASAAARQAASANAMRHSHSNATAAAAAAAAAAPSLSGGLGVVSRSARRSFSAISHTQPAAAMGGANDVRAASAAAAGVNRLLASVNGQRAQQQAHSQSQSHPAAAAAASPSPSLDARPPKRARRSPSCKIDEASSSCSSMVAAAAGGAASAAFAHSKAAADAAAAAAAAQQQLEVSMWTTLEPGCAGAHVLIRLRQLTLERAVDVFIVQLQCVVCMDLPPCAVFQCGNGHLLCKGRCYTRAPTHRRSWHARASRANWERRIAFTDFSCRCRSCFLWLFSC